MTPYALSQSKALQDSMPGCSMDLRDLNHDIIFKQLHASSLSPTTMALKERVRG
jgi:hypothetical protein